MTRIYPVLRRFTDAFGTYETMTPAFVRKKGAFVRRWPRPDLMALRYFSMRSVSIVQPTKPGKRRRSMLLPRTGRYAYRKDYARSPVLFADEVPY